MTREKLIENLKYHGGECGCEDYCESDAAIECEILAAFDALREEVRVAKVERSRDEQNADYLVSRLALADALADVIDELPMYPNDEDEAKIEKALAAYRASS